MERRKFLKLNSQLAAMLSLMPLVTLESCASDETSKNLENMDTNNLDVIVIGGGPAGMSAALVLGRSLTNTIIINEEKPRNLVTQASHGFLTRDGYHPSQFLQIAKEQLRQYDTVEYVKGLVEKVDKSDSMYAVATASGQEFKTKRIIFATGYKDDLSKVGLKGVEDVYGKSVYPCPFCDGWEHKSEPIALFGSDAGVGHFAKTIRNWTDDLIIFTNGKKPIGKDEKEVLQKNGIKVIEDEVTELVSEAGILSLVKLSNGDSIKRTSGFLFSTGEKQATDIPSKLGVEMSDWGTYESNDWGETKVTGIYIVGDAKNNFTGLIGAASEGSYVAEMITQEIINEKWIV